MPSSKKVHNFLYVALCYPFIAKASTCLASLFLGRPLNNGALPPYPGKMLEALSSVMILRQTKVAIMSLFTHMILQVSSNS